MTHRLAKLLKGVGSSSRRLLSSATVPIISPAEAAAGIEDCVTVGSAGFVGVGHAEAISRAIEVRFLSTGHPRDLTLVFAAGQGDRKSRGLNHYGHEGLLKRAIGGHWGLAPRLGALVQKDAIEAWNLPQGVISHMFRAVAGGKPGVLSAVGLHTFVDPRVDGGRLTPRTAASQLEPRVELVRMGGADCLFYPSLPLDVALLRATTADAHGNLSTENEPFHHDLLSMAQAARNSGGRVVAQVKRIVPYGTLRPCDVKVPGMLIDALVIAEDPDDHMMSFGVDFRPPFLAEPASRPLRKPRGPVAEAGMGAAVADAAVLPIASAQTGAVDVRKVVQRRALLELVALNKTRAVVNLGIGMPAGVGAVADEEGVDGFMLTVEAGPLGGTPADGPAFGASYYPETVWDQATMFDFYDGGGLDIAFLGLAEFDPKGNVNVSRFGSTLAGVGGFVNISQSTPRIVFMGTLTAGGLGVEARDGCLTIIQEGRLKKLLPQVQHLSFNGPYMASLGRDVLFVTERAVFALSTQGELVLTEIAPGVDLQRDVLDQCGAPVAVSPDLKLMDARIFTDAPMDLAR